MASQPYSRLRYHYRLPYVCAVAVGQPSDYLPARPPFRQATNPYLNQGKCYYYRITKSKYGSFAFCIHTSASKRCPSNFAIPDHINLIQIITKPPGHQPDHHHLVGHPPLPSSPLWHAEHATNPSAGHTHARQKEMRKRDGGRLRAAAMQGTSGSKQAPRPLTPTPPHR